MCGGAKAPKATPPGEPLKNVDAKMESASDDAQRQQAMRRGLASVWTRYSDASASATAAGGISQKADKLGG